MTGAAPRNGAAAPGSITPHPRDRPPVMLEELAACGATTTETDLDVNHPDLTAWVYLGLSSMPGTPRPAHPPGEAPVTVCVSWDSHCRHRPGATPRATDVVRFTVPARCMTGEPGPLLATATLLATHGRLGLTVLTSLAAQGAPVDLAAVATAALTALETSGRAP